MGNSFPGQIEAILGAATRQIKRGATILAGAVPVAKMGRRYKAYAAETGVTYHYFFEASRRVVRPEGQGAGSDFNFVVTADQRPPFSLKVFVSDRAVAAWQGAHGRALDANEQYAAAKMRLFRAFDGLEDVFAERWDLVVDETNVEGLLEPLSLA